MDQLINELNLKRNAMRLPGSRLLVVLCSVILLCFSTAGCGEESPSDTPELGSVSGIVTMDGKPLANVVVTFEPESGKPSFGGTDAEGHYNLVYSKNESGAKIGLNTVRITTPTEGPEDKGKDPVPAKFNTKSTLKKEVKAGSNEINFELTSN